MDVDGIEAPVYSGELLMCREKGGRELNKLL